MLATVHAGCLVGVHAHSVQVEVRLGKGLPGFELVGLPERGVRESRVRVRAAIASEGFELPKRSLVINLAPGDLRKSGAGLDLAIAVAVLAASDGADSARLHDTFVVGELSLSGELRPVRGVLPLLRRARRAGLTRAIVPEASASEAAIVQGLDVRVASNLRQVVEWLDGSVDLEAARGELRHRPTPGPDLGEVRGQAAVRRALEIAAAGGHHLLLIGPPGAGKSMLARRLPGLLPPPTDEEAIEVATIASAAGLPTPGSLAAITRPFRAPHHTASAAAMVGGGRPVRPGEVTLAHGGVLFLDELPEFRRDVIETLRTTMENGCVVVARAHARVEMPARPLIVAAMNPCPCGYDGDPQRLCTCAQDRVDRYRGRVSGPLLDRFDLHVAVPRVPAAALRSVAEGEGTEPVRERVTEARARAIARGSAGKLRELLAGTEERGLELLDAAVDRLCLSARGYVKALRVARTIADLGGSERVDAAAIAEAVQYRLLDRRPIAA